MDWRVESKCSAMNLSGTIQPELVMCGNEILEICLLMIERGKSIAVMFFLIVKKTIDVMNGEDVLSSLPITPHQGFLFTR